MMHTKTESLKMINKKEIFVSHAHLPASDGKIAVSFEKLVSEVHGIASEDFLLYAVFRKDS